MMFQMLTNTHITVERAIVRIENIRLPIAIGIIMPYMNVANADKNWNPIDASENPLYMFKPMTIKGVSMFIESDPDKSDIQKILQVTNINSKL